MKIDSILLGDNQFFGVNHLSPEKGRSTEEKFKDINEIKKIMFYAMDNGVTGVFFSTHPAVYQITDMMRKDRALMKLNIYVDVPFIAKYVRMVSQKGMLGTINQVLAGDTFIGKIQYLAHCGLSALTQNYLALANRLVDAELKPFYGLNLKAVFLHEALTGLALGYNLDNVIKNFYEYVSTKYGVIAAFDTLNFPKMCSTLDRIGVPSTVVMCAVNKKGYFMNPSRNACENEFQKTKHTVLAMSTLAAGSLHPEEAYEYLFSLKRIRNVVVGVSSKAHADETFKTLRKYLG